MIANFVGDVLFAEDNSLERFVNELTEEKKKTFGDFIRDFINWIKGIFGKTDEVRMFEKKYAELFGSEKENAIAAKETQLSFSPNLSADLDKILNGTFKASENEVYLGETSNFMTDVIGAESLLLYMPASKAYSSVVTEEEYNKKTYYKKQDNYHGIGKENFIKILEKSETLVLAFAAAPDEDGNNRRNKIVLVTDEKIWNFNKKQYDYAVVVEEVNTKALANRKRIDANKAITVYPRSQIAYDITKAIIDNRLLSTTKKGENISAGVHGAISHEAIQENSLKKNIAHFWANVKWESENKKIKKVFPQKKSRCPLRWNLHLRKRRRKKRLRKAKMTIPLTLLPPQRQRELPHWLTNLRVDLLQESNLRND